MIKSADASVAPRGQNGPHSQLFISVCETEVKSDLLNIRDKMYFWIYIFNIKDRRRNLKFYLQSDITASQG